MSWGEAVCYNSKVVRRIDLAGTALAAFPGSRLAGKVAAVLLSLVFPPVLFSRVWCSSHARACVRIVATAGRISSFWRSISRVISFPVGQQRLRAVSDRISARYCLFLRAIYPIYSTMQKRGRAVETQKLKRTMKSRKTVPLRES